MGYGVIRAWSRNRVSCSRWVPFICPRSRTTRPNSAHSRALRADEAHTPDHFAVEALFFGKNVQSMLKLGRAQGVALAAALVREVPVAEYARAGCKPSPDWPAP